METKKVLTKLPEIGDIIDGRICAGWHRIDTTLAGRQLIFGHFYTEIAIKFADYGKPIFATVVTKERF